MPGNEDLRTFLAKQPWKGGAWAWCCHAVPAELMAEIESYVAECRERGIPIRWRGITTWLTERGVEGATEAKISYHFERGHESERSR